MPTEYWLQDTDSRLKILVATRFTLPNADINLPPGTDLCAYIGDLEIVGPTILPGVNVCINARTLTCKNEALLNTSGKHGKSFNRGEKAPTGSTSGAHGANGLPGEIGGHAGQIEIICGMLAGTLELRAEGGNGGRGQDGGDGAVGQTGSNASNIAPFKREGESPAPNGEPGFQGGSAGRAGASGNGGNGGNILLQMNMLSPGSSCKATLTGGGIGGEPAEHGDPGEGGLGGQGAHGYKCISEDRNKRGNGNLPPILVCDKTGPGSQGARGPMGLRQVTPSSPTISGSAGTVEIKSSVNLTDWKETVLKAHSYIEMTIEPSTERKSALEMLNQVLEHD